MPPPPRSSQPSVPSAGWRNWILPMVLVGVFLVWRFASPGEALPAIAYSTFYQALDAGQIAEVTIDGQSVSGKLKKPTTLEGHPLDRFRTTAPRLEDPGLLPLLREKGVRVTAKSDEQPLLIQLLVYLLPFV